MPSMLLPGPALRSSSFIGVIDLATSAGLFSQCLYKRQSSYSTNPYRSSRRAALASGHQTGIPMCGRRRKKEEIPTRLTWALFAGTCSLFSVFSLTLNPERPSRFSPRPETWQLHQRFGSLLFPHAERRATTARRGEPCCGQCGIRPSHQIPQRQTNPSADGPSFPFNLAETAGFKIKVGDAVSSAKG